MNWTSGSLLTWAGNDLKQHSIESFHLEAEILLAHVLGLKRIDLFSQTDRIVSEEELHRYKSFIQRRLKHEPTAYLTGYQPFLGLDILVDQNVLIPRPETEQMVELAIDLIARFTTHDSQFTVADIGTGSGCIAVALAKHLPTVKVIGIDISAKAIAIAKKNADKQGVTNRCQFVVGNMLEPLKEPVDLIIANPPYIPTNDLAGLEPEVKDYEPRQALDGGADGLDYIRELIKHSPSHLKEPGQLLLEFGFNQAEEIMQIAREKFETNKIVKDFSGQDRFFLGKTRLQHHDL